MSEDISVEIDTAPATHIVTNDEILNDELHLDNSLIDQLLSLLGGCSFKVDEESETLIIETYIPGKLVKLPLQGIFSDPEILKIFDVIQGRDNSVSLTKLSNHALRQVARRFGIDPYTVFEPIQKKSRQRPAHLHEKITSKSEGRKQRNKRMARKRRYKRGYEDMYNKNFEQ